MGKIVLVTGGARSGKSNFAEKFALSNGSKILYIATAIPFDDEMKARIKKHRESRGEQFHTIECYCNFKSFDKEMFDNKDCAMLDCVTIMITNIIMSVINGKEQPDIEDQEKIEKAVNIEISDMLELFVENVATCVIVTNEIGMGLVPDTYFSRLFRDVAGRANQIIAQRADEVYFCVSGIPVKIK